MIQFKDNSDAFLAAARELSGEHTVAVSDLYDGFIKNNTPYSSLRDLLEAGGFKAETPEDIEAIPDAAIDAHIAKNTRFGSWRELQQALLQERLMGG